MCIPSCDIKFVLSMSFVLLILSNYMIIVQIEAGIYKKQLKQQIIYKYKFIKKYSDRVNIYSNKSQ